MSEEKQQMVVHKVILSTKKEVLLREMKIKYQELAMKAAGGKDSDNHVLYAIRVQKELLKILLVSIGLKPVTSIQVENLDECFSYAEYNQLNKALDQIVNGGDSGEFTTELQITGGK